MELTAWLFSAGSFGDGLGALGQLTPFLCLFLLLLWTPQPFGAHILPAAQTRARHSQHCLLVCAMVSRPSVFSS